MNVFKKILNRKKIILVLLVALGLLVPLKIGYDYYSSDYHSDLTAKAYNDIVNENINIVFYKKGCPYCEATMPRIKKVAKQSSVTTFYVDVETTDGKVLVKRFNIKHASTIVTIRNNVVTVSPYAYDKDNKLTVDTSVINNAF